MIAWYLVWSLLENVLAGWKSYLIILFVNTLLIVQIISSLLPICKDSGGLRVKIKLSYSERSRWDQKDAKDCIKNFYS